MRKVERYDQAFSQQRVAQGRYASQRNSYEHCTSGPCEASTAASQESKYCRAGVPDDRHSARWHGPSWRGRVPHQKGSEAKHDKVHRAVRTAAASRPRRRRHHAGLHHVGLYAWLHHHVGVFAWPALYIHGCPLRCHSHPHPNSPTALTPCGWNGGEEATKASNLLAVRLCIMNCLVTAPKALAFESLSIKLATPALRRQHHIRGPHRLGGSPARALRPA